MKLIVAFLALAATAAGTAGTVTMKPGEAVTILFDEGGVATTAARGRAPKLNGFEKAVEAAYYRGRFAGATGPNAATMGPDDELPDAPPPPRGEIRIKFLKLKSNHRALIVQNGYDRALAYRARLVAGTHSGTTDVCQVGPALYGFEWWPYPIERIELSDMRLVAWTPGQRPVCE